jgi:hypothetical protein
MLRSGYNYLAALDTKTRKYIVNIDYRKIIYYIINGVGK